MVSPVNKSFNQSPASYVPEASNNNGNSWTSATPSKLHEKVSSTVQSQVFYSKHTNPQLPVATIEQLEVLVRDPVLYTDTFISCVDRNSRECLELAKKKLFEYYKSDRESQRAKDLYVWIAIKIDGHRMYERKRSASSNRVEGFPIAINLSSACENPGEKINQYLDTRQTLINYYTEEFSGMNLLS